MRIAAAQTSSVWLDPDATTDKAIAWMEKAAAEDIDLVAFGETFLAGYPFWLSGTGGAKFNDTLQKKAYAAYLEAAVEIDGKQIKAISTAAADLGIFTYMGIAERGGALATGSVYATLIAVDPTNGVVSAHRKLRPTHEERLVWSPGDGHGLRVHKTESGIRVGGLNCWENWMPPARYALYSGGEDLHISAWPGGARLTQDITRFIAMEGRVWSLAAGCILRPDMVPRDFPLYEVIEETGTWPEYDGGSAIAAPDGTWVVEPVSDEERLVVADINIEMVREERQTFDPTGHYARPDVFEFRVNRRRNEAAIFED